MRPKLGSRTAACAVALLSLLLASCAGGRGTAGAGAVPARGPAAAAASTGAAVAPPSSAAPGHGSPFPAPPHGAASASSPAPPRGAASASAPAAGPASRGSSSTAAGPSVTVLAAGFGQPDDVAVAPDGTIYFSDFAGGRIGRLAPGAAVAATVVRGLDHPEGIVVLPDGSLVVAEQGRNRLLRVDPSTGAVAPLLDLQNHTRLLGVDGLGWDAAAASVIVPDSPNGRLLLLAPATGRTRVLVASGLGRPTGAALLSGSMLVADETGGRVLRLAPGSPPGPAGGGAPVVVARLPLPDDVVVAPDGATYVNSLAGSVWEIAPVRRRILGGLRDPQGLALAPGGSLVVVETGRNRLLRLTPPAVARPSSG